MSLDEIKGYLQLVSDNPHIQALLAVLLALAAAKLVDLLISRTFRRLTSKTRSELDDQILAALHRPVFLSVALFGLWIAMVLVIPEQRYEWLAKAFIGTLAALVWLGFFLRLSRLLLGWLVGHESRFDLFQPATLPLFDIAAKVVILGFGAYFILYFWHIDVTAWLASAGIAGLAIGLAAQDTLGNLFAGVSILADAPYKMGDYIVLDGGERGKVTRIGLRSTRILTRDEIEVTIPNSIIAKSRIVNESGGPSPKRRLKVPIGVAYGSDIDRVCQILEDVANKEALLSDEPATRIQFAGFGDSALNFEIRCWIDDPEDRGRATNNLNFAIYKALAAAGIEIPFPKRDVYIKEWPKGRQEEAMEPSSP